jgi:hypothetical protein
MMFRPGRPNVAQPGTCNGFQFLSCRLLWRKIVAIEEDAEETNVVLQSQLTPRMDAPRLGVKEFRSITDF